MTSINSVTNCAPAFKGKITAKEFAAAIKEAAITPFQYRTGEEFKELLTTRTALASFKEFDKMVAKDLADKLASKMAQGAYKPQQIK